MKNIALDIDSNLAIGDKVIYAGSITDYVGDVVTIMDVRNFWGEMRYDLLIDDGNSLLGARRTSIITLGEW